MNNIIVMCVVVAVTYYQLHTTVSGNCCTAIL